MKMYKGILLNFVFICALSVSSGVAVCGEYVAKQGDTWAKVAKETGNTVNDLAKMNKLKDLKDSDSVPAGQNVTFLSKDEIQDALKYLVKRKGELSYGTGEYSKIFADWNNLKDKEIRVEYSPDDPYPYGTRFTDIIKYAETWRGTK